MRVRWSPESTTAVLLACAVLGIGFATVNRPGVSKGFRVDVALPSSSQCVDNNRSIFVRVKGGGQVYINAEKVGLRDLSRELKRIFATRSDRVIFLWPDQSVEMREVIDAIDTASNQVKRIAIMSEAVWRDQGGCGPTVPFRLPPNPPNPYVRPVSWWPW